MQIHVLEYFEKGALRKCPDKVAVKEAEGELTLSKSSDLRRIALI